MQRVTRQTKEILPGLSRLTKVANIDGIQDGYRWNNCQTWETDNLQFGYKSVSEWRSAVQEMIAHLKIYSFLPFLSRFFFDRYHHLIDELKKQIIIASARVHLLQNALSARNSPKPWPVVPKWNHFSEIFGSYMNINSELDTHGVLLKENLIIKICMNWL